MCLRKKINGKKDDFVYFDRIFTKDKKVDPENVKYLFIVFITAVQLLDSGQCTIGLMHILYKSWQKSSKYYGLCCKE